MKVIAVEDGKRERALGFWRFAGRSSWDGDRNGLSRAVISLISFV